MKKDNFLYVLALLVCLAASVVMYARNDFFRSGGWVMVLILFSSILGFGLIFAKARQLLISRIPAAPFVKDIFEKLERQRIKEAIDLCDKANAPLSRVLRAGIMKYDLSRDEIRESMDNTLACEQPALEEHLPVLAALVEVLPLLGFLGTFLGLAEIFQAIQFREAASLSPGLRDISAGLWQMLVPPIVGMTVLIPLLLGYYFLSSKLKALLEDIRLSSKELLAFLLERRA
ncbi:MAG: MotA/TolQ/ExbB proton channel family protein [Candidatus Omnitrophota bacterium]